MTTGEKQPQQDKDFDKKVQKRAYFRSQRKSGQVNTPKDADFVQAEDEQRVIDEAGKNSRGLFDRIFPPAVKTAIKSRTKAVGRELGRVIGENKRNSAAIQVLTDKVKAAEERSATPGPQGEKGEVGPQGPEGQRGPQGSAGIDGAQGLPGKDGAAGADGKSAYEIAKQNGFPGTEKEWLDSQRGPQGEKGDTGSTGRIPRWMVPAIIAAAALAAGAYFFPRPEENNVVVFNTTPTTGAATGTPTPTPEATRMLLTGIPVPSGTEIKAGKPAIVREINWDSNDVWIWWNSNLDHSVKVGPGAIDGNALHVRDAWTAEGQGQWITIAQEALKEAQAIQKGSLGQTGMEVHFMQPNGGFGDVPNSVN